jgi:hypothetical protein
VYDKWIEAMPYKKRQTNRSPRFHHALGTVAAKMMVVRALMKRTIVPSNIKYASLEKGLAP